MKDIIDYGDNGAIPMIDSDEVEPIVNGILDYVENRFDLLDAEGGRDGDILALCQEFLEWGTAKKGDELSYYVCPKFKGE